MYGVAEVLHWCHDRNKGRVPGVDTAGFDKMKVLLAEKPQSGDYFILDQFWKKRVALDLTEEEVATIDRCLYDIPNFDSEPLPQIRHKFWPQRSSCPSKQQGPSSNGPCLYLLTIRPAYSSKTGLRAARRTCSVLIRACGKNHLLEEETALAGCSKSPPSKAAASESPRRYKPHFVWAVRPYNRSWRTEKPLQWFRYPSGSHWYVEGLNEARTVKP